MLFKYIDRFDISMFLYGYRLEVEEDVYMPREDTFLLADALLDEIKISDNVLEIGCGSGLLSLIAADRCESVVAVDVDAKAIETTKQNVRLNGFENVDIRISDIFESVEGKFGLIIFNPPYLPGDIDFEEKFNKYEQWYGGKEGREVLERFSESVEDYMESGGRALVVVSSLTDIDKTVKQFEKKGIECQIVAEKKVEWERLYVIKLYLNDLR